MPDARSRPRLWYHRGRMRLYISALLFALAVMAQDGRLVLRSPHVHQYSGISPLSAAGDKIHGFDTQGNSGIFDLRSGRLIQAPAPYPTFHWDTYDNDLGWVIGGENSNAPAPNTIYTWRPSSGRYKKAIDFGRRFRAINTGSTADITWDGWTAFWAEAEHNVCAVDLNARKSYCADYLAPDPNNHLQGKPSFIDYIAITPRDSKSGLHYVLFMVSPAMMLFSVDEQAGVLRLVVRPEVVFPGMGIKPSQNYDGNCDPGENCISAPHGDVLQGPDGQVYFVTSYGMEDHDGIPGHRGTSGFCEAGHAFLRLNTGRLMTKPENFNGVTGGGLKYVRDGSCGSSWPASDHVGCARFGTWCVVSFDAGGGSPAARHSEEWLLGLDASGVVVYKRLGANESDSTADYWSQPRGAMTMDATAVIYDSDANSQGRAHAVYMLPTGVSAPKPHQP